MSFPSVVRKAFLAGSLLLFLISCSRQPAPPAESEPGSEQALLESPLVAVAAVQRVTLQRLARAVGQLLADEETTISSEVSGRVERITVDFGSRVRAGQLLVALDPRDYRLAVERSEAAVVQSLAALGLEPGGDEQSVAIQAQPSVSLARAGLEDARTKLESAERLVKNMDIPEQRYLEAIKTVEQREAALREAEDRVRVQIATVRLNRTQLAIEKERLAKTQIMAPFDGTVRWRGVSVGQYVRDNTDLLTLVRGGALRLRGQVPESAAARVRVGMPMRFRTDAFPGRWFEAKLSDISPVLNPSSRTLEVEAMVSNTEDLLKPGMFASLEIVVEQAAPALVVPEKALFVFAGLTKLFVVSADGIVSELVVESGQSLDGRVEVIGESIREGDLVVVGGQQLLRDGMTVRVSGAGD